MLYREIKLNPLTECFEWCVMTETQEDVSFLLSDEWVDHCRKIGVTEAILELPEKKDLPGGDGCVECGDTEVYLIDNEICQDCDDARFDDAF